MTAPQEACIRISEALQEAIAKMGKVEEESGRMLRKARLDLEACDRELEEKAREVTEMKKERSKKKAETEKLESMARMKEAEADRWELKATEALLEADRAQSIVFSNSNMANKKEHTGGGCLRLCLNNES